MRLIVANLALACAVTLSAAAPATKATPKPAAKPAIAKPVAAKPAPKKQVAAKPAAKGKQMKMPVQTWRNRQMAPTKDRYKEIQQALFEQGYLASEPTGIWNNESVDALKRFQTDQKLSVTGKISSLTLINLGLGPVHTLPSTPIPSAQDQ